MNIIETYFSFSHTGFVPPIGARSISMEAVEVYRDKVSRRHPVGHPVSVLLHFFHHSSFFVQKSSRVFQFPYNFPRLRSVFFRDFFGCV